MGGRARIGATFTAMLLTAVIPVTSGASSSREGAVLPPSAPLTGEIVAADAAIAAGLHELTESYSADVGDFNLDGWPDVLLGRHVNSARLYRNDGGRFTEVDVGNFPKKDRHGCGWGDANVDGRPDVYCAIGAKAGTGEKDNELWLQQPDQTFLDQAPQFGVTDDYGRSREATFLDVNHDPYPDLFVLNKYPRPDDIPSPNRLYINEGGTRFRDAPEFGLEEEVGGEDKCAQPADFDSDGWEDLLVCGKHRLILYRNVGGTEFVDITENVGITGEWFDAELVDLDGDGALDLAEINTDQLQVQLQRDGVFAPPVVIRSLVAGNEVATGDVNGDGSPDIYVLQKCGQTDAINHPDLMLLNGGSGTDYTETPIPQATTGCGDVPSPIDFDLNGLTDFVVLNGQRTEDGTEVVGPVQLIGFFRCGTDIACGLDGDVNGDGHADLALGVPGEDLGTKVDAGAVNVVHGGVKGLTALGNQLWTQDSAGVEEVVEPGDGVGQAVATGDFNGDRYADLAIGAPGEDLVGGIDAGVVNVLYGSPNGLTSAGDQLWSQDSAGIVETAEPGDRFGASLATGDLDGDGFDDLAVGVAGESLPGADAAGAVQVLYGSAAGLAKDNNQVWSQGSGGVADLAEAGDAFGAALAVGDLDGDAYGDLAVGVPGEDIDAKGDAGMAAVLFGSAGGITSAGNQTWSQDSDGVPDAAEATDAFGSALAIADLGRGPEEDLAVGVPSETLGSLTNAGAVDVIYGSPDGPVGAGSQVWTQNVQGVKGVATANEGFGTSLAAADLGGLGYADLAIGVPGDDVGTDDAAGSVNVLYGAALGLSAAGDQLWNQDSDTIADTAEAADGLGADVWAADYGGDVTGDLVAGVPFEDLVGGARVNAGAATVLYGSAQGLTGAGNQAWTQNTLTILDVAESGDLLGTSTT